MDSDSEKSTSLRDEYSVGQIAGITLSLITIVESLSSHQLATAKVRLGFISETLADLQKEDTISPMTATGFTSVVSNLAEAIKAEQERRAQHSGKVWGRSFFSAFHPPITTGKEEDRPPATTRKRSLLR